MSTWSVKDAAGATVVLEKPLAPGRAGAAFARPVVLSNEDKTTLDSIDSKMGDLRTYTDGLEALATLLNGYVDGLEALVTSTNINLGTLHTDMATTLSGLLTDLKGYTDGLETLVTSSNSKLDTIHTDLGTTLSGLLTDLKGYTDQLEGYVDGIETLIGTTNSALTTIQGYVDGLEGLITSTNAALNAGLAANASGLTGGIASTARLASAAATTNATNVKTSAGRVYSVQGYNVAAYVVFLVLYDAAANPPVPGTTTIRKKIPVPPGAAFALDWPVGMSFANGIGYAFTKLPADADVTALAAGDILAFNLDYN
jgi:hypothetical protein